ncbi:MAG: methionine--tRNA ligase subunit beta [Candidatus Pacebacteria bacterium CG10_big_fil_rev_8_21_14_0_10_42_12]|nr:MAG: methionine--tRNA ligase subunit beta [Candidatus Pacebacteria bacterium CG10_big_fil_rev_8_21_14_0_10_42_12]
MTDQKPIITYDDFSKLDMRVATILAAEPIEGADKLLKLTLDVGELGERTIAAGIKLWYEVDDLVGKQIVYLSNLEPRRLRGVESQGMLVAADDGSQAILLHPDRKLANGSVLR